MSSVVVVGVVGLADGLGVSRPEWSLHGSASVPSVGIPRLDMVSLVSEECPVPRLTV